MKRHLDRIEDLKKEWAEMFADENEVASETQRAQLEKFQQDLSSMVREVNEFQ